MLPLVAAAPCSAAAPAPSRLATATVCDCTASASASVWPVAPWVTATSSGSKLVRSMLVGSDSACSSWVCAAARLGAPASTSSVSSVVSGLTMVDPAGARIRPVKAWLVAMSVPPVTSRPWVSWLPVSATEMVPLASVCPSRMSPAVTVPLSSTSRRMSAPRR